MSELDEVLRTLSQSPESHLDKQMASQLAELIGAETAEVKDKLRVILDKCAFYSLASDFVMRVLDLLWRQCGGSDLELRTRKVPDEPPSYP